ncbi:TerD family protein [Sphingomonas zeicaulis]|uniref:TerD family protein n=1 Tax=Sphingomonas zeicaulis TaxID=1632740 RepID=UPI003D1D1B52
MPYACHPCRCAHQGFHRRRRGRRIQAPVDGASETAMVFGELCRRHSEWTFRAVGQGFAGGLAPLARSFGIEVAKEPLLSQPAPPMTISLDKPDDATSHDAGGGGGGDFAPTFDSISPPRGAAPDHRRQAGAALTPSLSTREPPTPDQCIGSHARWAWQVRTSLVPWRILA